MQSFFLFLENEGHMFTNLEIIFNDHIEYLMCFLFLEWKIFILVIEE